MTTPTTRRDFLNAGLAGLSCALARSAFAQQANGPAELVLFNGRITTLDRRKPEATAVAIANGRFVAVGDDKQVLAHRGANTQVVDLQKRTVIPGLNDSHLHLIRGGLNYNMELRWDGVPSLADALTMLREQARRTPPPQWVRVVGGWTEFQFQERRMPTLEEINAAAPDTPVFVLHLYDRAWLNQAAVRAVAYTKDTPDPPGGEIQRDKQGNPTGLLVARPNAKILYDTLAKGPKLPLEDQINSTRLFMREMNRLGVTSCIDAGGGYQNYPDDYKVISELAKAGELTVRIAYNLFTQRPTQEMEDFANWIKSVRPSEGDDFYRMNGAGEMLVYSAADFEDFLEPRPDLAKSLEAELTEVVTLLAKNRWPFRLHATYDETISRALDVFEAVHREVPFNGLRWFFDHAETISEKNIERVKALSGGIAVQHRLAYQGEYFLDRYGREAAEHSPPIARMLQMDVPVGAGTDGTRVASYNPWVALYWLVTGKTVGGTVLYPESNRLDRTDALRRYTLGSAWFSGEEDKKGSIEPGRLADLAVLSADYFSVPDDEIKRIESVLTVLGGNVVYAADQFAKLSPPPLRMSPDWSPVSRYGGRRVSHAMSPEHGIVLPAHYEIACWSPSGPGCDCFVF
ncbi:MAG TPA: amidohydrolase [Lacipirellulaceae bacterium]|nr:amidohydrolase [Lacipirellulaceae bacterium]